jgi:hypothetical protein
MLEILSLVACGWLFMFDPTNDPNRPIAKWEQIAAFDSAADCEQAITSRWKGQLNSGERFYPKSNKCVPADSIYPSQPKK